MQKEIIDFLTLEELRDLLRYYEYDARIVDRKGVSTNSGHRQIEFTTCGQSSHVFHCDEQGYSNYEKIEEFELQATIRIGPAVDAYAVNQLNDKLGIVRFSISEIEGFRPSLHASRWIFLRGVKLGNLGFQLRRWHEDISNCVKYIAFVEQNAREVTQKLDDIYKKKK